MVRTDIENVHTFVLQFLQNLVNIQSLTGRSGMETGQHLRALKKIGIYTPCMLRKNTGGGRNLVHHT